MGKPDTPVRLRVRTSNEGLIPQEDDPHRRRCGFRAADAKTLKDADLPAHRRFFPPPVSIPVSTRLRRADPRPAERVFSFGRLRARPCARARASGYLDPFLFALPPEGLARVRALARVRRDTGSVSLPPPARRARACPCARARASGYWIRFSSASRPKGARALPGVSTPGFGGQRVNLTRPEGGRALDTVRASAHPPRRAVLLTTDPPAPECDPRCAPSRRGETR